VRSDITQELDGGIMPIMPGDDSVFRHTCLSACNGLAGPAILIQSDHPALALPFYGSIRRSGVNAVAFLASAS